MPLLPGEITVNPTAAGWTGVPSWFWLEPTPRTVAAVAVLGAERIVVTAQPHPVWRFGDGAITAGSAGRAYRRGAGVAGSVRHEYETRCLPGDAGRNLEPRDRRGDSCARAGEHEHRQPGDGDRHERGHQAAGRARADEAERRPCHARVAKEVAQLCAGP